MFLSKLVLNARHRAVRRDLADCHEMHRTLLSAFPQADSAAARDEFGLLYRVDAESRSGQIAVIVQSRLSPDWRRLPAGYLLDVGDNPACKTVDDKYTALRVGQRLVFRLRANPTRKIDTKTRADGTKSNGKRVELRKQEDLLAWLLRKADKSGFHVNSVRIDRDVPNLLLIPEGKATGWRADEKIGETPVRKKKLTFNSVLFEGELTVEDAELFRSALQNGIGSAKAYGFGLLSIGPVGG
jgi:CRISPR system Cascade subunit CasE